MANCLMYAHICVVRCVLSQVYYRYLPISGSVPSNYVLLRGSRPVVPALADLLLTKAISVFCIISYHDGHSEFVMLSSDNHDTRAHVAVNYPALMADNAVQSLLEGDSGYNFKLSIDFTGQISN